MGTRGTGLHHSPFFVGLVVDGFVARDRVMCALRLIGAYPVVRDHSPRRHQHHHRLAADRTRSNSIPAISRNGVGMMTVVLFATPQGREWRSFWLAPAASAFFILLLVGVFFRSQCRIGTVQPEAEAEPARSRGPDRESFYLASAIASPASSSARPRSTSPAAIKARPSACRASVLHGASRTA